jgi:uncharacterized protein YacL
MEERKDSKEFLHSAGGIILIILAILIEGLDLIPLPFLDQIVELPLEIIFIFLYKTIANVPLSSCILPFLIERIPIISDLLPTWLIKIFI